MNGKELRSWLTRALIGVADVLEVKAMLQVWLEFRLGWKSSDWILKEEEILDDAVITQFQQDVEQLQTRKPLQYVLGEAWFAGNRYLVNKNVLIPRPETEELVEWILTDWPDKGGFRVIDLGTGSGIIPITLKMARPNWEIFGADISKEALTIAHKNATIHETEISWITLDMLTADLPGDFDLIISNPPYIPQSEASEMTQQVVAFEPELALFVPDNMPLLFYQRIAELSIKQKNLKAVYLELHKNKALETSALFEVISSEKTIRNDLNGHPRMLRVNYTRG